MKLSFGYQSSIQDEFVKLVTINKMDYENLSPTSIATSNVIYTQLMDLVSDFTVTDYGTYIIGNYPYLNAKYAIEYVEAASKLPRIPPYLSSQSFNIWVRAVHHTYNPEEVQYFVKVANEWGVTVNGGNLTRNLANAIFRNVKYKYPKLNASKFSKYFDVVYGYSGGMCETVEEWVK